VPGRTAIALLPLLAALSGCRPSPPPVPPPPPAPVGERFDPADSGTIEGRVVWEGPVPAVEPFLAPSAPNGPAAYGPRRPWPNPAAPVVDPDGRGVAGAVVFLRGVDPARARPWDHPPVVVEVRDDHLFVRQGGHEGRTGFVRRGEAVEVVSRSPVFQAVQARGAAFFSLPLPDAGRPWSRHLDRAGVVELGSGAGRFWMRGWLFVDDQPYYVHTAADGSFTLPRVPAGSYELVCRLPNWHVAGRELDADSWQVTRVRFAPAVEITRPVRVGAGGTAGATLAARADLFPAAAARPLEK
jgi:hypothetical protein